MRATWQAGKADSLVSLQQLPEAGGFGDRDASLHTPEARSPSRYQRVDSF